MKSLFGRFFAGDSFWHRRDSLAKLALAGGMTVAVVAAREGKAFLFLPGAVVLLWTTARLPWRGFWGLWRSLSWLIWAGLLTGLFTAIRHPGGWTAGVMGLAFSLARLFLLLGLAGWLAGTTSPLALLDGLLRLATPLRRWGWDEEKAGLVLGLGLRLFPELFAAGGRITLAQRARGLEVRAGRRTRMVALEAMVVALFTYAFRRADELALAMRARGYGRHPRRSPRSGRRMDLWDRLVLLAGPVTGAVFIWLGRR